MFDSRLARAHALTLAWFAAAATCGMAPAADVTLRQHDGGVAVLVDGQPFTDYLIKTGPKPILWPIVGPQGREMTRAFPMRKVEGEKKDHPHQRSLWFTHGDVNGVDFWTEGPGHGAIVHRDFLKCQAADGAAVVSTVNDWRAADGKKVCEDVRTLTFRASPDARSIDFDITLKATDGPVKFGDTKEGTMGVRVPTVMDVDKKLGGQIVNSQGQRDAQAWGKPAAWVDYHGPLDGEVAGIAVMNHPTSFRFPTHWHVRTYGLFAANPFGLHDFLGKDDVDGSHTLAPGESLTLRYRFLFHKGDEKSAGVADAFEAYSRSP